MQQAISYKIWHPTTPTHEATATATATPHPLPHDDDDDVAKGGGRGRQTAANICKFLSENALSVLGRKGCCMATVVRRLLLGLGVNPAIYEVEGETEESEVLAELRKINIDLRDVDVQLPTVFIGGKLFGGLDRVMETHITGELVPILKDAGALWL